MIADETIGVFRKNTSLGSIDVVIVAVLGGGGGGERERGRRQSGNWKNCAEKSAKWCNLFHCKDRNIVFVICALNAGLVRFGESCAKWCFITKTEILLKEGCRDLYSISPR